MVSYLVRRVVYMLLLLVLLSFVSFVLIELPPGDALSTMIQQMRASGRSVSADDIRYLEQQYGLNRPFLLRYGKWFFNLLQGDMGQSLIHGMPVNRLISERYWLTVTISFASLLFVFAVAVPIGIHSATHQYAPSDYVFTVFGFIGLATPNFLLALLLQFVIYRWTNWSVGGLFSPEYALASWSFGKVVDLFKHLPLPLIVIGSTGTAGMIRVLRATLAAAPLGRWPAWPLRRGWFRRFDGGTGSSGGPAAPAAGAGHWRSRRRTALLRTASLPVRAGCRRSRDRHSDYGFPRDRRRGRTTRPPRRRRTW